MFHEITAFLVFLFVPSIPCLYVVRLPYALSIGPLASAVTASFAAIVVTWIPVPIVSIWLTIWLTVLIVVLSRHSLRKRIVENARQPINVFETLCSSISVVFLLIVVSRVPAPLAWDARSIWLFHASWFSAPLQDLQAAFSLKSLTWSHPDYPPLGPGSIATLWQLSGNQEHLRSGVVLLTALPIFTLNVAVLRLGGILKSMTTRASGSLFFVALLPIFASMAGGLIDKGYMDIVQAAAVLLVAALLLERLIVGPSTELRFLLIISCLFASLAKQEGTWFVIVCLLALALTDRSHIKLTLGISAVIAIPAVMWNYTVNHFGYEEGSDASGIGSRLGELLSVDSEGFKNVGKIIGQYFFSDFLPMTFLLAVALVLILGHSALVEKARVAVFISACWSGHSALIVLTYSLGETRSRLDWWLSTSFTRIASNSWAIVALSLCLAISLTINDLLSPRSVDDEATSPQALCT